MPSFSFFLSLLAGCVLATRRDPEMIVSCAARKAPLRCFWLPVWGLHSCAVPVPRQRNFLRERPLRRLLGLPAIFFLMSLALWFQNGRRKVHLMPFLGLLLLLLLLGQPVLRPEALLGPSTEVDTLQWEWSYLSLSLCLALCFPRCRFGAVEEGLSSVLVGMF